MSFMLGLCLLLAGFLAGSWCIGPLYREKARQLQRREDLLTQREDKLSQMLDRLESVLHQKLGEA